MFYGQSSVCSNIVQEDYAIDQISSLCPVKVKNTNRCPFTLVCPCMLFFTTQHIHFRNAGSRNSVAKPSEGSHSTPLSSYDNDSDGSPSLSEDGDLRVEQHHDMGPPRTIAESAVTMSSMTRRPRPTAVPSVSKTKLARQPHVWSEVRLPHAFLNRL